MYKVTRSCACGRTYTTHSDERYVAMCNVCFEEELEAQDPVDGLHCDS